MGGGCGLKDGAQDSAQRGGIGRGQEVEQRVLGQAAGAGGDDRDAAGQREQGEPRLVFDPKHPLADAKGYVTYPNVSVVEEMTNMISASRSYQTNIEVMNTAKTMMLRTLQIGQG